MEKVRTSAALGLFDGVHVGHREVLNKALAQKQNGLQPCAFTFSPETTAGKGAEYIYGRAEIRFLKGRLKFGNAQYNAPFPSMIVIFSPNAKVTK